MPANYVLLQRIELNASAASVTFSNIPQSGYTDLKVVYSIRTDRAGQNNDALFMKINGNMTSLSTRLLEGDGSSAASYSTSSTTTKSGLADGASATASTFANGEIYIPNYTGSTNKSYSVDAVTENNATSAISLLGAGLWSSTAAITYLDFVPGYGTNFVQYSTFSLYGLAATGTTPVIAPKATGGNITSDGTYWIHTFNSTGTFTPLQGLSCDALVVAGGGGGGNDSGATTYSGGGGGGGGYRTSTLSLASATSYTVTVGSGGTGGASGTNGNDSILSTITSTGGGRGGTGADGSAGGSGGGGGGKQTGTSNGGAGNTPSTSPSQGNTGGNNSSNQGAGGGGGGATSVGANSSGNNGGNGGAGTANSISGSSVTYAGGGGGGPRPTGSTGTHGGGNFANGGGGGNGAAGTALNGNSGIVIIRYPIA